MEIHLSWYRKRIRFIKDFDGIHHTVINQKNSHRINVTRKYIRELLILDFVDYAYVYKKKNLHPHNY